MSGNTSIKNNLNSDGQVTINDSGADKDTRIEGTADQNLVFVDASLNRVGIGHGVPEAKFHVNGTIRQEQGFGTRIEGTGAMGVGTFNVGFTSGSHWATGVRNFSTWLISFYIPWNWSQGASASWICTHGKDDQFAITMFNGNNSNYNGQWIIINSVAVANGGTYQYFNVNVSISSGLPGAEGTLTSVCLSRSQWF
jgi:hypothetical protein